MSTSDNVKTISVLRRPPTTEIPPDADLMSFVDIHFPHVSFRQSREWSRFRRRPELFFYFWNLIAAGFHSLPAGSVADDDLELADAAGATDEQWAVVKAGVMEGWTRCADERWRHPLLTDIVMKAWKVKKPKVDHAAFMRERRAAKNAARRAAQAAEAERRAIEVQGGYDYDQAA